MTKRLFLIRHGPTHVKRLIGHTDVDVDLSNQDRIDAIYQMLPQDAVVVSSDLKRARFTADAIAGTRLRLPHDKKLREFDFGDWEDSAFDTMNAKNQRKLQMFYDSPGEIKAPGGESWNDVETRVCARIEGYLQDHPYLVVVAHMGVILTYLRRATGKSAFDTLAQKIEPLSVSFFEETNHGMKPVYVNKLL